MNSAKEEFKNPFRPGAGHMPPYLAGRDSEINEFKRLLTQEAILENMVLTGLRGVGKTVLLDTFKPIAISGGWMWVGTNFSESACLNEENVAIRLLTDLSVFTSSVVVGKQPLNKDGFKQIPGFIGKIKEAPVLLNFGTLQQIYSTTPGLVEDKIKKVLEIVWDCLSPSEHLRGLIFAYDEAQNLSDHAVKEQYPLSILLDVFQSIQKRGIPFMLVLTGLPTLFPKLVEARTYTERMFRVVFLNRLKEQDIKDAIQKPIQDENCPIIFDEKSVETIISISGGYPYFIQFICREVYDIFIQKYSSESGRLPSVPVDEIIRKLDTDFFAGRYARATDRQRDLLRVIAQLPNSDSEFTVQEIVEQSKKEEKPFSNSHVSQMLTTLSDAGLVYRNRYGKYAFAVPLLGQFIKRQVP